MAFHIVVNIIFRRKSNNFIETCGVDGEDLAIFAITVILDSKKKRD